MGLHSKTILITRAASQTGELRQSLEAHGARVLECPAIEIIPVDDWTRVDRAVSELSSYHWIIFTSTNAVEHFMPRVALKGAICDRPIAAIGTSTARKLQEWSLTASRIPANFRAEGLLEMFPVNLNGERILIPRAENARELLPEELRRRGAAVDVVPVYRTVKSGAGLSDLRAVLSTTAIDAIAFTSPSAIRSVAETLGDDLVTLLASIPVAVIGPVARDSAESVGLKVEIQPERATVQDLAGAINQYFT